MKIKEIHLSNFKRFTDFTITNLKQSNKLIVVIGPNGCGKTSLFEAFYTWMRSKSGFGFGEGSIYYQKDSTLPYNHNNSVQIEFFEGLPISSLLKKVIYLRTAYRNQDDFSINSLSRQGNPIENLRFGLMINNDQAVAENYQRLISASLDGLYNKTNDAKTVLSLREELIGKIHTSVNNVFSDLHLNSIGDPIQNGNFYFQKGKVKNFHYKNLSGGEKSAFDLIIDVIIKSKFYDDSVYCIDEPEAHMHTDIQAKLLRELYNIIPQNSQLWIASHSIGMLNEARQIEKDNPGSVAFLDLDGYNFDEKIIIEPAIIDSSIWTKFLNLTLGSFSQLIGPEKIILCEGDKKGRKNKDFDATCYNKIFNSKYNTHKFISIGNSLEVEDDNNKIKLVLEEIFKKEKMIRLVDRDDKSETEIQERNIKNIRVLKRRHIESYLYDDEVILRLCDKEKATEDTKKLVLNMKKDKINASNNRGNAIDDIKSASGEIYVELKKLLSLTQCGNTEESFIRDTLLELITPETVVYKELESEIFL